MLLPTTTALFEPGAKRRRFRVDNQMLIQIIWHGYAIGKVTCPTDYNEHASSIKYGFGCLQKALTFRLGKMGLYRSRMLSANRAAQVGRGRFAS